MGCCFVIVEFFPPFISQDRISLRSPDCPVIHTVDQAYPELTGPPAFASGVLGLKAPPPLPGSLAFLSLYFIPLSSRAWNYAAQENIQFIAILLPSFSSLRSTDVSTATAVGSGFVFYLFLLCYYCLSVASSLPLTESSPSLSEFSFKIRSDERLSR